MRTETAAFRSLARWTLLLSLGFGTPSMAGQLRSIGFEEMAQRADRIFAGRCLATEVISDPRTGLEVTRVTFAVERAVKGELRRTLTVKLLGAGATAGGPGRESFEVPGFTPGERVVLFLYADSALGLTSPVGLGQGKFTLHRDKAGRELAVNAFGNKNLLGNLEPSTRERLGGALARWDGKSGLSGKALLDGARDLLALGEKR